MRYSREGSLLIIDPRGSAPPDSHLVESAYQPTYRKPVPYHAVISLRRSRLISNPISPSPTPWQVYYTCSVLSRSTTGAVI
jgi:hypothetical protein